MVLSAITFSSLAVFFSVSLAKASTLDSEVREIAVLVAMKTAAKISMTIAIMIKLVKLFNYLTAVMTKKENTYTIQYGDRWLDDYLIYTEWLDNNGEVIEYTIVNQDGETITDG